MSDRVIAQGNESGIITATASTFIHTDNPYLESYRERFRRIRVLVTAPGYAPHPVFVPIPPSPEDTVELGTLHMKPVTESVQFDAQRFDFIIGSAPGFILIPPEGEMGGYHLWLWYAPTFIGGLPNDRHADYFRPLLDAGFFIAGVDVGESFGSPEGTAAYQAFYEHVVATYHLSPKPVLLPQSRGGLMLYNWAVEHPDSVGAVAGIYTVCSLESYPGVEKAAPAYKLAPAELEASLMRYDPINRVESLAKAGVPIFHIHGDSDTVVPIEANAGELVKRYQTFGGNARIKVVPGKGHAEIDEFFTDADFLAFMLSQAPSGARHE